MLKRLKVVEEYNKREQEIKVLEKELEEKTSALSAYRQNISEVCVCYCSVSRWFSLTRWNERPA